MKVQNFIIGQKQILFIGTGSISDMTCIIELSQNPLTLIMKIDFSLILIVQSNSISCNLQSTITPLRDLFEGVFITPQIFYGFYSRNNHFLHKTISLKALKNNNIYEYFRASACIYIKCVKINTSFSLHFTFSRQHSKHEFRYWCHHDL